jgi:hypothetical protein
MLFTTATNKDRMSLFIMIPKASPRGPLLRRASVSPRPQIQPMRLKAVLVSQNKGSFYRDGILESIMRSVSIHLSFSSRIILRAVVSCSIFLAWTFEGSPEMFSISDLNLGLPPPSVHSISTAGDALTLISDEDEKRNLRQAQAQTFTDLKFWASTAEP